MALMLYVLSYISLVVHVCFATVSFAAGLYYISELVEEYTETSKKIIKYLSLVSFLKLENKNILRKNYL